MNQGFRLLQLSKEQLLSQANNRNFKIYIYIDTFLQEKELFDKALISTRSFQKLFFIYKILETCQAYDIFTHKHCYFETLKPCTPIQKLASLNANLDICKKNFETVGNKYFPSFT